ncbi:DMT family transporter [Pseudohoeflea coraliihabitans]|uniref:DMT family transporter n=1 Tax=Pseudohoeflea coraliihabitans TaxID=2860393 RepID=A0ABS6WJ18_9HYPH|nr:DMT family transporter [Pseudohoeflea sp. DP4N28-3]MBW3095934.1 DMT family transporter [Pseudohoeflea sp. DP4N28-3]
MTYYASTRPAAHPVTGYLLGLAGVAIFGGTLPATRLALEGFSPGFITFGRALIAACVAAAALALLKRRPPRRHLPQLLLAGLMLAYGFPGFSSIAMQTVPSAHGGVVLGVLPLMTAAFAALIAGERPGPAFWAWGVAGAVLVVAFSLSGGDIEAARGDLWLVMAAISAACGYVISGKLARTMPGWEVIAWMLVFVAPISLIGTVVTWDSGFDAPGSMALSALAYLSLGSMFLGFVFWNRGLALGGIARIGQVQLLQSFFTLAFAALILGETVAPVMIAFAVAVAGVVFMGRKSRID